MEEFWLEDDEPVLEITEEKPKEKYQKARQNLAK